MKWLPSRDRWLPGSFKSRKSAWRRPKGSDVRNARYARPKGGPYSISEDLWNFLGVPCNKKNIKLCRHVCGVRYISRAVDRNKTWENKKGEYVVRCVCLECSVLHWSTLIISTCCPPRLQRRHNYGIRCILKQHSTRMRALLPSMYRMLKIWAYIEAP